MARAFEQVIRLQLEKYSPEAARRMHIEVARKGLAAFLGKQQERPGYSIETDGHDAASEESVKPFGVIVYRFTRMRQIAAFAKAEAVRLSPKLSGRYRNSWFFMVDGKEVDIDSFPPGKDVLLTNDQPYSRKINVGAKGFEKYANPGVVEKVKELVKRRFGRIVDARVIYITLAGGHVLQKDLRRKNRDGSRGNVRKDARKGADLTYPTLLLAPKH